MRPKAPTSRESGFTLLEILIAMIVLAVGGVGILSLFAVAVTTQYNSVINEQKARILSAVMADAQHEVNRHAPTADDPAPPDVERRPAPILARDYEVAMSFSTTGAFPAGEGAIAQISIYYRGRQIDSVRRIFQRTVFSDDAIKESVSYEMDRRGDAARAAKDGSKDGEYDGRPK